MELGERVGFVVLVGWVAVACGGDEVAGALVQQREDAGALALDARLDERDVALDAAPDTTAPPTDVDDAGAQDTIVPDGHDTTIEDVPPDATVDDTGADDGDAPAEVADDAGPVGCDKPDDCPEAPACWRATCVGRTCGTEPVSQGGCDDGDACTLGDRCVGGACEGEPKTCDDGNPCTSDACAPELGQCAFTPIPDCVTNTQCVGKEAGTACDDADAETAGDLCLDGACRGFVLHRVVADEIEATSVIVSEIDHDPTGWSVVLGGVNADGDEGFALARLTTPSTPEIDAGTLQGSAYKGLVDGFVADADGYVWQRTDGGWTIDNPWDDALWLTGRAEGRGLWTMQDSRGHADTRRLWIVGDDGIDEWIRYCHDDSGEVVCEEQDLDDFEPSSLPVAVAGVPSCDPSGCERARLALAADAWAESGNYNDTFESADGVDATWDKGAVPGAPVQRASRAIAGWGEAAQAQFLAVGTGGYVVHRRANGGWSPPLALKDGQATRTFSGVVAAGGLVAIVAHRSAGGGQRAYELWTAPARKDVEVAANWTVHALLTATATDGAGLYDVDVAAGEVRIVGAIARVVGDEVDGLDGLVLVRGP